MFTDITKGTNAIGGGAFAPLGTSRLWRWHTFAARVCGSHHAARRCRGEG
eukprot:gene1879-4510_t